MSKRVKSGTGWLFGLLVAAALAVGARTAFSSTGMSGCTPVPPGQAGTCATQQECEDLCDVFLPNWQFAICNGQGCCHCYL
jgi:hypothetical protein